MLLKSLELQGFKTFPDKTTLTFDRGITAVVGPNGSGKSNISDAMRWVLGEQSTRILRCSRMEDVIFNGTLTRRAQGYAEVTLTIDNSGRELAFDSDAVAVTRRYYRSGDSEYLLNKAAVRLRDIHELFMDTGLGRDGYSIIGQGKIDSIVGARSEDRREVFEEAAGISRFRYRKEDSERRLRQAEENLLRLRDILSELEARVGPLREQAEKAKQYLEYEKERRGLEIGLWLNTLARSAKILRENDDRILVIRGRYEEIEKQIEEIGRRTEENFSEMNGLSAKADGLRNTASAKDEEAVRLDGNVLVLENDCAHNRETAERLRRELEQAENSGRDLDKEIAAKDAEIAAKAEDILQRQQETEQARQSLSGMEQKMAEYSGQIEQAARLLAEQTERSADARVQATTAASSMDEISRRLDAIAEAGSRHETRRQELSDALTQYRTAHDEWSQKAAALTNAARGYEMRLETRRKKAETLRGQVQQLQLDTQEQLRRAKLLEDLEKNMEGFQQSVKTVMKEASRGTLSGIHGPVSRLFRVRPEWAVAIETALGGAMQNIAVSTEQDAKRAIALLKQRDGGRATFLPISTMKGRNLQEPGLEDCPGFVGIAAGLCEYEDQYAGILSFLLGRIAVAEDLDSAVSIARRYQYRFRIVTLDGQVVNTGGSLTGGSLAKNSGLLGRASEIERIRQKAAALEQKLRQAEESFKAAQQEASAAEASLAGARGELSSAQEETVRLDAEIRRVSSELQTLDKSRAELDEEAARAKIRRQEFQSAYDAAQEALRRASEQMERANETLSAIGADRDKMNAEYGALAEKIQELKLQELAAHKDKAALEMAREDLLRRRGDQGNRVQSVRDEILAADAANQRISEEIVRIRKQAETLRAEAETLRGDAAQLVEQRMELEKRSSELRVQERDQTARREEAGHELARLEERRDGLQKEYDEIIRRLWEEYSLTRREAESEASPIEDVPASQRRLNELKGKIRALGSVNVAAVEEYREVSGRYEFLKSQIDDAEKSRGDLLSLIRDLTRQMRDLFLERFARINENFGSTFRELFEGGTASLALSDPEDVLGSGIEISVQPPGKIVTHLEALSGGEKALVAIALYFAIMKVNPPPFCVMDEIEAALDDVNVDRFAAYLRRMNESTQFIAITHRRGTMEEADVLYGVTMQDEGVSKLLELRSPDQPADRAG